MKNMFPTNHLSSSRDDVYKTAANVTSDVGHVTILINNAGVVHGKNLVDLQDEEIEKTLGVNLMAHFWVSIDSPL
jgi:all-trans-retinol dehydrogenase (NAD+)